MFDVIHVRSWLFVNPSDVRVYVARELPTLAEAKKARKVSGDLVFYSGTLDVVPSCEWLWDWEKESTSEGGRYYAMAAVMHAKRKEAKP